MKNLLLIDGSNIFFRAYYANRRHEPDKHQVHRNQHLEAHLFLKQIVGGIERFAPCVVVLFWDSSFRSAFRTAILDTYKAHRKDAEPEDKKRQVRVRCALSDLLKAIGMLEIVVKEVEADDLIAYFYRKFNKQYNIRVLSNDSDLQQFPGTTVIDANLKVHRVDKKTAREIVMQKIICGDVSDNIKGIGGVGSKRFKGLYAGKSYESLILEFADKLEKLQKIEENRQLCNLLAFNNVIVDREAQKKIRLKLKEYREFKFKKLHAGACLNKYGLRNLQQSLKVFGANYEATNDFCRLALRQLKPKRRTINL